MSIVQCQRRGIVRDRIRSLNCFLREERNGHLPGVIKSVLDISGINIPVRVYLQLTNRCDSGLSIPRLLFESEEVAIPTSTRISEVPESVLFPSKD